MDPLQEKIWPILAGVFTNIEVVGSHSDLMVFKTEVYGNFLIEVSRTEAIEFDKPYWVVASLRGKTSTVNGITRTTNHLTLEDIILKTPEF